MELSSTAVLTNRRTIKMACQWCHKGRRYSNGTWESKRSVCSVPLLLPPKLSLAPGEWLDSESERRMLKALLFLRSMSSFHCPRMSEYSIWHGHAGNTRGFPEWLKLAWHKTSSCSLSHQNSSTEPASLIHNDTLIHPCHRLTAQDRCLCYSQTQCCGWFVGFRSFG